MTAPAPAPASTVVLRHHTVQSALGPLLLLASPAGLTRLAFAVEHHESILIATAVHPDVHIVSAPELDGVGVSIDLFLRGRSDEIPVTVDLAGMGTFKRKVLEHTLRIPYGETRSYAQIADALGNSEAVRAVGAALSSNPLPLVFPCHRVVRGDGTAGAYVAGSAAKKALLAIEQRHSERFGPASRALGRWVEGIVAMSGLDESTAAPDAPTWSGIDTGTHQRDLREDAVPGRNPRPPGQDALAHRHTGAGPGGQYHVLEHLHKT